MFHEPETVPISAAGMIGESSLNGPMLSGYEFDAAPERVGTRDEALPGQVALATAVQPNLEWQGLHSEQGADLTYWESDEATATFVRNVLAAFGVARGG